MIFVAGYHATGKSHLARMLSERFGTIHIETSAIVRGYKERVDPLTPMGVWARGMETEYGATFFDDLIVTETVQTYEEACRQGHRPQDIIVTGNRSLDGIRYTGSHINSILNLSRQPFIVAITVEESVMLERFRERNRRPGDSTIDIEGFRRLLKEEEDAGIRNIYNEADFIIDNSGSEVKFLENAEGIARDILGLEYRREGEDFTINMEGRITGGTEGPRQY